MDHACNEVGQRLVQRIVDEALRDFYGIDCAKGMHTRTCCDAAKPEPDTEQDRLDIALHLYNKIERL